MNPKAYSRYTFLRVQDIVDETSDSKSLVFDIPTDMAIEQKIRFAYKPGQFLTLRLKIGEQFFTRCYSMSSAPGLDPRIQMTVKRVHEGLVSNWLCDNTKVGDLLEVLPPAGVFSPDNLEQDFLLVAGGSGITPIISILRSVLALAGASRIRLFYANRDVQSVIFSNALLSLERDHPHRLEIMHWLESEKGLPTSADLFAFAKHSAQAQSYVCGPTPFIVACETALLNLGMDSQRIHIERFFSLSEEWQSNQNPITNEVVDLGAMTQVTLQLDDQLLQFQCASDETVMDAARRANIELPHACLAGICASCMCLVQSGSVFLRANEALDEKDLAKGWTLACQALPTSAHLILKLST